MSRETHVEGIYYNTSATPVFLEGMAIGGHEYVFIEGYLRVPGHFIEVTDPKDDPDAPETFRVAYERMMAKGQAEKRPTHYNSVNERSNVVPVEQEDPEPADEPEVAEEKVEEKSEPVTKSTRAARGTRKGKGDSASDDKASQ